MKGRKMREFTFQCGRCHTSVTVRTACPAAPVFENDDPNGELLQYPYTSDDSVGGNSRNGDYEVADLCPACGRRLRLLKTTLRKPR